MRDRQHATTGSSSVARTAQQAARPGLTASQASVIQLQATAGNAAVTGLLRRGSAPTIQRVLDEDDESELSPSDEPGSDEPATDEPAPADASANSVEDDVAAELDPDNVVDTLAPIAVSDEELGDFEAPDTGVTAQALFLQRDPPNDEPAPTRPAGAGDVIKALMPFLKPALDALKANVLEALAKIKAGDAVVTVIVVAPIIIGPLTLPGPRRLAIDQLDGTDVTFGLIPHLQLKPQITDGQLRGGTVTYDLAPALRKAGLPF